MYLDDFKKILFDKNKKALKKAYDSTDNKDIIKDDIEYFILFHLFKNLFDKNIETLKNNTWIHTFSEELTNYLYAAESRDKILQESLFNLFPQCDLNIGYGGIEKSCEAFHISKDERFKTELIKELFKYFKTYITSNGSLPIPENIVFKIIEIMPFEKNDLLNIDFFQENNELFKQHGENIIKCTDTVKRMNLSDQFVERGTVCENPQILPNSTKNYLSYNIYDWMYHHKIDYKETNKPTEYDFPIKLSGYINRLKEIRGRLVCKECRNLLIPNYKYAINSKLNVRFTKKDEKWHLETKSRIGAFYRCTIFECKNHTCNLQNNHIYINHCNGANCGKIIDSRDITNKCTNGWNICNNCYSCCKQPYINRKQTELLRGNELNALIKKHYHGSCPKCSSYLKLFSKVNKRGKKELFIYCRKNKTKDCDFKVSNGYIHKRYYKLKSIFLRNGPFRSNLKIPC